MIEIIQWIAELLAFVEAQSQGVQMVVTVAGILGAYLGLVVLSGAQRLFTAVVRRIEGRFPEYVTLQQLEEALADQRRLLTDGQHTVDEPSDPEAEDAEEVVTAAPPTGRPVRRTSVVTRIRRQADAVVRLMAGGEWAEQRKSLDRLVRTIVPAITARRQEVSRALVRLRKLDDGKSADARPGASKTREHVMTLERLSSELEGQLDAVLDALVGMEATILGHRENGAGLPATTGELTQLMDRVEGNARNMADALREVSAFQT